MGAKVSKTGPRTQQELANAAPASNVVQGHSVPDFKTGVRWATDPIVSDSTVTKKPYAGSLPGLPGEEWGPYPKKYTKSVFGQNMITPPETIDGVPILCRCRDIAYYVRNHSTKDGGIALGAAWAITASNKPPACWEDSTGFSDPTGGTTYKVITRHPDFYLNLDNKRGVVGIAQKGLPLLLQGKPLIGALFGGTRKKKRTSKNKTRRNRKRV